MVAYLYSHVIFTIKWKQRYNSLLSCLHLYWQCFRHIHFIICSFQIDKSEQVSKTTFPSSKYLPPFWYNACTQPTHYYSSKFGQWTSYSGYRFPLSAYLRTYNPPRNIYRAIPAEHQMNYPHSFPRRKRKEKKSHRRYRARERILNGSVYPRHRQREALIAHSVDCGVVKHDLPLRRPTDGRSVDRRVENNGTMTHKIGNFSIVDCGDSFAYNQWYLINKSLLKWLFFPDEMFEFMFFFGNKTQTNPKHLLSIEEIFIVYTYCSHWF